LVVAWPTIWYGLSVNPGETLPTWIRAVAPLILIAVIFLGGIWLQNMERKARLIEKQRAEPKPPDENHV
jgi:hypothetical protein